MTNELILVQLYYITMGYGMYVLQEDPLHNVDTVNVVYLFVLIGINVFFFIYSTVKSLVIKCKSGFCQTTCVMNLRRKYNCCLPRQKVKTEADLSQPKSYYRPDS